MKPKTLTLSVLIVALALALGVAGALAQNPGGRDGIDIQGDPSQSIYLKLVKNIDVDASAVTLVEDTVYAAAGRDGLQIIDISDPTSPVELGTWHVSASAAEVMVVGKYAYVNCVTGPWVGKLYIVDISEPAKPVTMSSYDSQGSGGLDVVSNYAYVAAEQSGHTGLLILDVSNPAIPTPIGFYDAANWLGDVRIVGDVAYLIAFAAGIEIVDVSNPASPQQITYYPVPNAVNLDVQSRYAYVSARSSGLVVLDVSTPRTPILAGSYEQPGWGAEFVHVRGPLAYVTASAESDSEFKVLAVDDSTAENRASAYGSAGTLGGLSITQIGSYDAPEFSREAVASDDLVLLPSDSGVLILSLFQDRVTVSIPPDGGSLSSTSGDTILRFPSGAFTAVVTVTYKHLWTDQETGLLAGIHHTFDLSAVDAATGLPAQLTPGQTFTATVHYAEVDRGIAIENTLALYRWNGSRWFKEPTSVVDTTNNTVTATLDRLSLWAVLGETQHVLLPIVLSHR